MLTAIYPIQVILITSRYNDKDNIMTCSWHMPVSFAPELYAIAIGKSRFTLDLIKKSKVFAINFIPKDMEKQAVAVGRVTGRALDKFGAANLEKDEAEKIDCPVLKEALSHIECEVINTVDVGDHFILIGKVVNTKHNKEGKRLFQLATGNKFTTTLD